MDSGARRAGEVPSAESSIVIGIGRHRRMPAVPFSGAIAFLILGAGCCFILTAARFDRPRRTAADITSLLAGGPHKGDCDRCHGQHPEGSPPEPFALLGPNDNSLCDGCHTQAWVDSSYAGTRAYSQSSHGLSQVVIWPGPVPPPRTETGAAGKCVNCHDPHGWKDAGGEIPRLLVAREQALCLTCHDGSPAASNVQFSLQKPFRHPTTDVSGRHTGPGESTPADFAAAPINRRHAECEDCHNPHVARGDSPGGSPAPAASLTTLGVSRILVQNGPAGSPPTYVFLAASDTVSVPIAEYQLCFKCHSSWTVQPSGQTDLALVLNPDNPSYHPVEAAGRNSGIQAAAFEAGWSAASLTRCRDCHGGDMGLDPAPHGSSYRYLLSRPATASAALRTMTPDELCFACHAYAVYADPSSPESVRLASRFNKPGVDKGHAEHVGERNVPCYACHVTHGSTTFGHLIVTGRTPGLSGYAETASGGTCSPTCHGSESYQVNYAR